MASQQEIQARIKEFFSFSKPELIGLAVVVLLGGLLFSFCAAGVSGKCATEEVVDLTLWFGRLILLILVVGFSVFVKATIQKIFALSQGYKIVMKTWFTGTYVALALALLSFGKITLIFAGSFSSAFMVKQRLGEFRYGFSNLENALIGFWGIMANIGLALFFAIFNFAFPENYIFAKAVTINIIMGFCNLLPFPQLDGLKIFFGSRSLYYTSFVVMLLSSILIFSGTKIGLIALIVMLALALIIFMFKGSEK